MQPSKVGDFFIGFLGLIAAGFMLGLMTIPLNSVSGPCLLYTSRCV